MTRIKVETMDSRILLNYHSSDTLAVSLEHGNVDGSRNGIFLCHNAQDLFSSFDGRQDQRCHMHIGSGARRSVLTKLLGVLIIAVVPFWMTGCAMDQATWNKTRDQDTRTAYQSYLEQYPTGDFVSEARDAIEQLDYLHAKSEHITAAYEHFLTLHPKGKLSEKARSRIEDLTFAKACQKDTLEAYGQFLEQYPDGMHSMHARVLQEEADFEETCQQNSLETYQLFSVRWPESRHSPELRTRVNELKCKYIADAHEIRVMAGAIDKIAPGSAELLREMVKSIFSESGLTSTEDNSAPLILIPSLSRDSGGIQVGETDITFMNTYTFTVRLITKSGSVLFEHAFEGEVKAYAKTKTVEKRRTTKILGLDAEELSPKLRTHLEDFYRRYVASSLRSTQRKVGQPTGGLQKHAENLLQIKWPPASEVRGHELDGQIIRIDEQAGVVYLNIGADDRVCWGLTFAVYDRHMPISIDTKAKASIEVFEVANKHSIAQVMRRDKAMPIVAGDVIANLIWDSNKVNVFAVAGEFDLDSDGESDHDSIGKIKALIENWGGKMTDTVSAETDFVILGSKPEAPEELGLADSEVDPVAKERYDEARRQVDYYRGIQKEAQTLRIPIFDYETFLSSIGCK